MPFELNIGEFMVASGVAGLGRAFTVMLPIFLRDPRVTLVAAADPRAEARARFTTDFSAKTYRRDGRTAAGAVATCGHAPRHLPRSRERRGGGRAREWAAQDAGRTLDDRVALRVRAGADWG